MLDWTINSASVTGTSHELQGTQCQDAHAHHATESAIILAVSDGAGSTPHGGAGALLATTAATSYLAGALGRRHSPKTLKRLLNETVDHARAVIHHHAIANHRRLGEYATTLHAAILTKDTIGILQIGDGAIITQDDNGSLRTLTRQQDREYVNEVTFLTCDDYKKELHVSVQQARRVRAVCLLTDGVETLSINRRNNTPHQPFFTPLLGRERSGDELAALLSTRAACDITDDDKTIIVATKGTPCTTTTTATR